MQERNDQPNQIVILDGQEVANSVIKTTLISLNMLVKHNPDLVAELHTHVSKGTALKPESAQAITEIGLAYDGHVHESVGAIVKSFVILDEGIPFILTAPIVNSGSLPPTSAGE